MKVCKAQGYALVLLLITPTFLERCSSAAAAPAAIDAMRWLSSSNAKTFSSRNLQKLMMAERLRRKRGGSGLNTSCKYVVGTVGSGLDV